MKLKTNLLEKQKFASLFFLLAVLFYCFCNGEFRKVMQYKQCSNSGTFVILKWKCKLCNYEILSDLMEKEMDWEGLK